MAGSSEICRMDAVALAAHVRARRLSPVEVIDAVLDRMERLEPALHAFCTPAPELARREARELQARIAAGEEVGALAGVPLSIKDLILTRGMLGNLEQAIELELAGFEALEQQIESHDLGERRRMAEGVGIR